MGKNLILDEYLKFLVKIRNTAFYRIYERKVENGELSLICRGTAEQILTKLDDKLLKKEIHGNVPGEYDMLIIDNF